MDLGRAHPRPRAGDGRRPRADRTRSRSRARSPTAPSSSPCTIRSSPSTATSRSRSTAASCRCPTRAVRPRPRRGRRSRARSIVGAGEIVLNAGRATRRARGHQPRRSADPGRQPLSTSPRPTARCDFDRARGLRACGSTSRPAPRCASSRARQDRALVAIAGDAWSRRQRARDARREAVELARLAALDERHEPRIDRRHYADIYGPTTGDRVRLGDTGARRRGRARPHASTATSASSAAARCCATAWARPPASRDAEALDCVITNALIVDWTGIYKADVGIKHGRIAGIGKAGNPDVMAGVDAGMIVGVTTEAIAGEGLILTAGGIDAHIHFICPQQADEALASGVTTFVGGGTGPATGTNATTCTPGARHIELMLQATDALPLNFGLTGKGNTLAPEGLVEQIARRRDRPQAPRGLGHDAGRDRLLPRRRRGRRRPGHDPHRHAQRVGLRRRLDRRVQGPHDPHLPHRGRGRRPRARTSSACAASRTCCPSSTNPTRPVHGQHARRAPRHADGLPPPRPRASPRTSRSPRAASAARRSPPRTSSTTSARSA